MNRLLAVGHLSKTNVQPAVIFANHLIRRPQPALFCGGPNWQCTPSNRIRHSRTAVGFLSPTVLEMKPWQRKEGGYESETAAFRGWVGRGWKRDGTTLWTAGRCCCSFNRTPSKFKPVGRPKIGLPGYLLFMRVKGMYLVPSCVSMHVLEATPEHFPSFFISSSFFSPFRCILCSAQLRSLSLSFLTSFRGDVFVSQ